jgi:hypothetical protein
MLFNAHGPEALLPVRAEFRLQHGIYPYGCGWEIMGSQNIEGKEISVGSSYDQSHCLHPYPYLCRAAYSCQEQGELRREAPRQGFKDHTPEETHSDIHGGREFIVKLQPPVDGGDGPWLCYDKTRSFEAYIPASTDGLDRALRLLQDHGIKGKAIPLPFHGFMDAPPSLKAYLFAEWESPKMRIYLDKVAPTQSW